MKKILKLLAFCLILSLTLTACAPKEYEALDPKEYGCFYFPGFDWGMSVEELYERLGKEASDFEITEKDRKIYVSTELSSKEEIEIDGNAYKLRFVFINLPDSDDKRLAEVVIPYTYNEGERSIVEFEAELGEYLKTQNVEFTTKTSSSKNGIRSTWFTSSARLSGLPQEMRDSYNGYMRNYYKDEIAKGTNRQLSKIDDFTVDDDHALTSVWVQSANTGECGIFFQATIFVYAQMCIEEYEQS